jgi:hypothetical protein
MKKLLTNTIITALLLMACTVNATTRIIDKTDATNISPYKELMKRSDEVKVFYTDNLGNINCRVEVTLGNKIWKASSQKLDKQTFLNKPLMSCLSNKKAKQLLARTFIDFGIGL